MSTLCALRNSIARIEGNRTATPLATAPLGIDSIDRALGGGLTRGRLHELFAAGLEDIGSAAGFAAMLARLMRPGPLLPAPLLWVRQDEAETRGGRLHAPGLADIGIDPTRMVLVVVADPVSLLRAASDVVRCAQVGVAVIELWGRPRALDLTASRRLAVSAEESGVTVLMLRGAAEPAPSAAQTRWRVAAAPSQALDADAPGHPAFDITLLRQRGRPDGGEWRVEWDREHGRFRERAAPAPPLYGTLVPAAAGGPAAAALRA